MPSILGHNYVGGARSAAGNLILRSLDADSGEALPYAFVQATEAEVDAAARAAERAYPHYRQLSATRRAGFLEAIASRLDALGDDFVALVRRETALPAVRIQGERTRTANQLRLFAEVLRRGDFHGARIDRGQPGRTPPRPDLRQWRIGLGPVAVFGASNFPLAFSTAGGDSAAALAAGCPVVVKAHGGHMGHSRMRGRRDPPGGGRQRHAGRGIQHGLRQRRRRGAGAPSGHPRGRLHRFAQGRARTVRPGSGAAAADPGVRRDEQHQSAGGAPRSPAPARPAGGGGAGRLGDARLRPVLHQAGPGAWPALPRLRRLRRGPGRGTGRQAGTEHAKRRYLAQLCRRTATPGAPSRHPAPGRRATGRTAGPSAVVQGRRGPVAGRRRTAPGRGVRPGHRGRRGGRRGTACPRAGQPARPVDGDPDRRSGRSRGVRRAGPAARTQGRAPAIQRLSDRRRGVRRHGPRRPLPGHLRRSRHLGGNPGHRAFPAPAVLPGLPRQPAPGRPEERQPAGPAAPGRWPEHARGAGLSTPGSLDGG
ncbi:semialdehyde dehydrogenase [Pseudomonas aeruginosa PADK2_CF510]|nr:semialdehyde dehydrogenase [Pseudomonas aeruginosa PADK2_CF510]